MKTIKKYTDDGDIQFFEIIESKKELASFLRDALWESLYSQYATGIYDDEDMSTWWIYKDGSVQGAVTGERLRRPNVRNIVKLYQCNPSTTVLYGDIPIKYNEHYGDWEAVF
jgi:hypothetical protein